MDKVCKRITEIVLLAGVTAGAVACNSTSSANPLSPHIAGPLAGVTITAPTVLEPADGAFIKVSSQPPLLVVFTNASSNSPRPFVHQLEIATVSDFSQVLFSANNIPPGPDGKASYDVPEALAPEVYYLRVRGRDGANTGPFSNPTRVEVYTPVVLEAPTPLSPIGGETITTTKPALVVQHGSATGPVDSISYQFEIRLRLRLHERRGAAHGTAVAGYHDVGHTERPRRGLPVLLARTDRRPQQERRSHEPVFDNRELSHATAAAGAVPRTDSRRRARPERGDVPAR